MLVKPQGIKVLLIRYCKPPAHYFQTPRPFYTLLMEAFPMNATEEQNKPMYSQGLLCYYVLHWIVHSRQNAKSRSKLFAFYFSGFKFKTIVAFFYVIASPGEGWHFSLWRVLLQLSLTIQKKTLKIKALRKDPEASAKGKKVIQLPWMKALFNIVYFSFRLKIASEISLQMYIYCVHIYSPHKKSLTETEGNVYLSIFIISKHCFWIRWNVGS